MPGTFFGITIGQSGLAAAQLGQDVTGQNIANAGTAGYSVQTLDLAASDPYTPADKNTLLTPGQIGTGVSVAGITRARDQFLDRQVRDSNAELSSQTSQSGALKQVDDAFGEPSDTGLNAALTSFFSAFQDLANNPESAGVRTAAVQKGAALAGVFQGVQSSLTAAAAGVSGQIAADVQSVNGYSSQVAALNVAIKQNTVGGQLPNDLLDRRDLLLDKLSSLANITTQNNPDGTVNVAVGSTGLVTGVDAEPPTTLAALTAGGLAGGALAGLGQSQTLVAGYQTQLNAVAASVASQVNAAQAGGLDLNGSAGTPFFQATAGKEAATLAVTADLQAHPEHLAAASVPVPPATFGPGDGSNAQAVAGLLTKATAATDPLGGGSIQGFYQQAVSDAGGRAASALTAQATAQATNTQLTQQRESVSGVSTDTELANLLKYQRAYQASARVITTADDMIGTLINNLFSAN